MCSAVTGSPDVRPSIPAKPEPIHTPGHSAPFGVVRRQPDMTFVGRVKGRDLPCQVVVSGAGCELVDAHRHTHPKGVHTAPRSGRRELLPVVHGVYRVCDLRSLRWLMRIGGRPGDVDTHWCGRARCRCMARGSRVSLDCCYEHAGLCPGRGPSGPAPLGDGRLTGKGGASWRSCSTGSPVWMSGRIR